MPPLPVEGILIITGAARSGTSMLRDVISTHPAIRCVPYDVNYIWRLGNEKLAHDELDPALLDDATRRKIRSALSAFHEPAHCLVEKTVSNALRIPFVHSVYPEAKLVHIVRNGYDVVESVRRQWTAPVEIRRLLVKAARFPWKSSARYAVDYASAYFKRRAATRRNAGGTWGPRYSGIDDDVASKDLMEVCALQWQRCVQAATRDLSMLPEANHFTIRYEEFVSGPIAHLERVAELMCLDASPYRSTAVAGMVNCRHTGKSEKHLSEAEINSVMPIIEPTMAALGYRS